MTQKLHVIKTVPQVFLKRRKILMRDGIPNLMQLNKIK